MALAFFQQERIIFFPQKLPKNYQFKFDQEFEEIFIPTKDIIELHGLLFKAPAPKGVVFYLHGNAGSLDTWGEIASVYTDLNYDIFILDYRGFGKSEGNISSEEQLFDDVQTAYAVITQRYSESQTVVIGYSIGTGAAAMLASVKQPKQLILQAPYYSLGDLMRQLYPFIPAVLLKYKFDTYRYIQNTEAPIAIFHGGMDKVIYPGSTEKLRAHLKPTDRVILLEGQGHNGMNDNPIYRRELAQILSSGKGS
ncbi:alpha/beta hydrolase [Pontibacter harenae]|uniref:alpha/beta hydrolase n=1 Tax=Pontibacter harenae TaxID=2894083 RepID=UPI001E39DBDE|nr:alpha/beta fold hydrolase [Pontibacter harenae]MCC9168068.1 alpha/beta hydrolase [Pontibacter harenae]